MPAGEPYGQELILDLHGCEATRLGLSDVRRYFGELCTLIDMEPGTIHFYEDKGSGPKSQGFSAVQFIITSSIVVHALPLLGAVYVNIFSCKTFDTDEASRFTASWFGSTECTERVIVRQ